MTLRKKKLRAKRKQYEKRKRNNFAGHCSGSGTVYACSLCLSKAGCTKRATYRDLKDKGQDAKIPEEYLKFYIRK